MDFPSGPVVRNLPANAEEHRFNLCPGKIPYATEQPTSGAPTTETHAL